MTWSILARDPATGEVGAAVASRFLAVGAVAPRVEGGIGAACTQALVNPFHAPDALARLAAGEPPENALAALVAADAGQAARQVHVLAANGRSARHTGAECVPWCGHLDGPDVSVAGNMLAGEGVLAATRDAFVATAGRPLAERLLAALEAGEAAGGDKRGRQSAALLVVREEAGYAGGDDIAVDLRVDDHATPVAELGRLLDLNDLYLTASTEREQVPVSDELRAELEEFARTEGHPDFATWVGSENYEMRVADDGSWIDHRVLAILRDS
jgi:uncharacterized Ntn-hydrolase superfamily protein